MPIDDCHVSNILYIFYDLFVINMHFTALQTNIQLFVVFVPMTPGE